VEPELFHVDGQTDRHIGITQLIAAFRSCTSAPQTYCKSDRCRLKTRESCIRTKTLY